MRFAAKWRGQNRRTAGIIAGITVLAILAIGALYWQRSVPATVLHAEQATALDPAARIVLPDLPGMPVGKGFTCTGLTYDSREQCFWAGNYGAIAPDTADVRPSLVKLSMDLDQYLGEIPIKRELESGDQVNLQGVAYDVSNDSLWYADGKNICNIAKSGELLRQIGLGKYERYAANGVAYAADTDTLWVLCYREFLLHMTKDGNILAAYACDLEGQDHLFVYEGDILLSAGTDYHGKDNYICRFNKDTGEVTPALNVQSSYAIEGICVVGHQLYVANDGFFHAARDDQNTILVYELGETL